MFTRFSRDRPRFTDALDVIKFLCKDLWTLLFRKQIDNLKTNHRVSFFLGRGKRGVFFGGGLIEICVCVTTGCLCAYG